MKLQNVAIVFGGSLLIIFAGSFLTYPPYAKLSALLFLIISFSILALREGEIKCEGEEGLDGESRKGSKSPAKEGGKVKGKEEKGKGKKAQKSKGKRKKQG